MVPKYDVSESTLEDLKLKVSWGHMPPAQIWLSNNLSRAQYMEYYNYYTRQEVTSSPTLHF